jgi:hypothetical protein
MRLQPLTAAPSAGLLKPETRLHLIGLNPGHGVPRILVGVLTRIQPCTVSCNISHAAAVCTVVSLALSLLTEQRTCQDTAGAKVGSPKSTGISLILHIVVEEFS